MMNSPKEAAEQKYLSPVKKSHEFRMARKPKPQQQQTNKQAKPPLQQLTSAQYLALNI